MIREVVERLSVLVDIILFLSSVFRLLTGFPDVSVVSLWAIVFVVSGTWIIDDYKKSRSW